MILSGEGWVPLPRLQLVAAEGYAEPFWGLQLPLPHPCPSFGTYQLPQNMLKFPFVLPNSRAVCWDHSSSGITAVLDTRAGELKCSHAALTAVLLLRLVWGVSSAPGPPSTGFHPLPMPWSSRRSGGRHGQSIPLQVQHLHAGAPQRQVAAGRKPITSWRWSSALSRGNMLSITSQLMAHDSSRCPEEELSPVLSSCQQKDTFWFSCWLFYITPGSSSKPPGHDVVPTKEFLSHLCIFPAH